MGLMDGIKNRFENKTLLGSMIKNKGHVGGAFKNLFDHSAVGSTIDAVKTGSISDGMDKFMGFSA